MEDGGRPTAKKSVCIRIPREVLRDVDLYARWAGLNRTDAMVSLIKAGVHWTVVDSAAYDEFRDRALADGDA